MGTLVVGLTTIFACRSQAITCPTFTNNDSCYEQGGNACSSGSCYRVDVVVYCVNGTDQIESQKVVNATTPWFRCKQRTGSSKSCAETVQECGTTRNYYTDPDDSGLTCDEINFCSANWVRTSCGQFRSDPCNP